MQTIQYRLTLFNVPAEVFAENWKNDYRFSEGTSQTFFTVFAIYFPAVTGIQAGANICGDLKNPASAIPKGTLWALLVSMTSYVIFVFFAGGAAVRDSSGLVLSGNISQYQIACLLTNHVNDMSILC